MSHDDAQERSAQEHGLGLSQSMYVPLDLPIDFEAFYLAHQEAFHAYAEVHCGTRAAAEEVIHEVFLEIHTGWPELLSAGHVEQGAWAIVRRAVRDRLESEGRAPAFTSSTAPSPRPWPRRRTGWRGCSPRPACTRRSRSCRTGSSR
ncbi:sigma factor [Streptomyces sp. SID9913]|uniref:RNA polymerase sigma factor n=1 Tax=Streptomyces sp. SID9913 TaxID=2706117 RepID=UPI0031BBBB84